MAAGSTQAERGQIARIWAAWLPRVLSRQCLESGDNRGAFAEDTSNWYCGRHCAYTLARLMAARVWLPAIQAAAADGNQRCVSAAELDEACGLALDFLLRRQSADGRLDLGGMYSANEVGFPITGLVLACKALAAAKISPAADFESKLASFLHKGAQAVLAGSPMTANHRWSAAAAPLAAIHSLWPDKRYISRIEGWLSEGIDIDADGCWHEERSPNYNSVASQGLLALSDLLGRPELLEPLLRHGEFLLHGIQPGGEFDSTISHRQDRSLAGRAATSYGVARRLALLSNDGRYTALASLCRQMGAAEPEAELVPLPLQLDAFPAPLPAPVPLPDHYEIHYRQIRQTRLRSGETLVSLAADPGGHFYDTVRDRWGGARRSDDWLHIHHGDIVIESLRLAAAGMQNLQPASLEQTASGQYHLAAYQAGWVHPLHFSPGRPEVFVNWDWRSDITAVRAADSLRLHLRSTTPHSLIASLLIWVRPGVCLEAEGRPAQSLKAGEIVQLSGSAPLTLRSASGHAITLSGLPAAEHRHPVLFQPGIPSPIAQNCAALHLGLRFPVDLELSFDFN